MRWGGQGLWIALVLSGLLAVGLGLSGGVGRYFSLLGLGGADETSVLVRESGSAYLR